MITQSISQHEQSQTAQVRLLDVLMSEYKSFLYLLIIFVLFACAAYFRASNIPYFTRAESAFTEISREMVSHGNLITPFLFDVPYFDKPILSYWPICLTYKLLGVSLLVSRLPSILESMLCLVITALVTRRLFGNSTAILAVGFLATNTTFLEFASSSMPDMLLCLLQNISLVLLYAGISKSKIRDLCFCLASCSMGLAFLTKGPIGLVFPVATAFIFLILLNKLSILKPRHLLAFSLIPILINLPWHAAIATQYGGSALDWLYLRGNVDRFLGKFAGYNFGHPPLYMIGSIFSGFFPWSILIPFALFSFGKKLKENGLQKDLYPETYQWLWIFIQLGIFSYAKSNWGYYMLPAYPALAVITARYLEQGLLQSKLFTKGFALALNIFFFVGGVMSLFLLNKLEIVKPPLLFLIPFVLLTAGLIITICLLKRKYRQLFQSTFFFLLFASIVFSIVVLPVKAQKDGPTKIAGFLKKLPKEAVFKQHSDLAGQDFLSNLLVFETTRFPEYVSNIQLEELLSSRSKAYILLPTNRLLQLPEKLQRELKIEEKTDFKWIDFPGCSLQPFSKADHQVSLVLVSCGDI